MLYPLLNHTQLRQKPHYKRDEILKLLEILSGARSEHFAPPDDTTVRLVNRCMAVPWLKTTEEGPKPENPAHRFLGMSLGSGSESSMTVLEVAAQSEKPGVMMPSKSRDSTSSVNGSFEIAGEA